MIRAKRLAPFEGQVEPGELVVPHYEGYSIVNLINAALARLGLEPPGPPLPRGLLPEEPVRRVVLLLIDAERPSVQDGAHAPGAVGRAHDPRAAQAGGRLVLCVDPAALRAERPLADAQPPGRPAPPLRQPGGGPETDAWRLELRTLAFALEQGLFAGDATPLDGTLLLITSDHGQLPAPPKEQVLKLKRYPGLTGRLRFAPTGEYRAC